MGRPQQQRVLVRLRALTLLRIADLPLRDGRDGGEPDGVDVPGQHRAVDLELAGGCGKRVGLRIGEERLVRVVRQLVAEGTLGLVAALFLELGNRHDALSRGTFNA